MSFIFLPELLSKQELLQYYSVHTAELTNDSFVESV